MTPNELVEEHMEIALKVATKYARRDGQLFEELKSVCLTEMVSWANKFDPKANKDGYAGFPMSVAQRCKWAACHYLEKESKHKEREPAVLEGGGSPLVGRIADRRQDDPAKIVEAGELVMTKRNTVKISEVSVKTPTPEAGKWAADLRAACYDAVSPSDMSEIMKKVVKMAKAGDLRATGILLDYLCGGKGGHIVQQVVVQNGEVE